MPTRPRPAKIKSVIAKCLVAAFCLALAASSDATAQTAPVTAGHFGDPVSDWTGAYVGGHIGAAWGRSDWSASGPAFPQSGVLGLGGPFDFAAGTGSYFEGLQAGYNRELPSGLVIGALADVSFPNTLLGTQTITAAGFDVADYQEQGAVFRHPARAARLCLRPLARLRHRRLRVGRRSTHAYEASGAAAGTKGLAVRSAQAGSGAGVETNVGNNWTANLEYLFTDFGSPAAFPADADFSLRAERVSGQLPAWRPPDRDASGFTQSTMSYTGSSLPDDPARRPARGDPQHRDRGWDHVLFRLDGHVARPSPGLAYETLSRRLPAASLQGRHLVLLRASSFMRTISLVATKRCVAGTGAAEPAVFTALSIRCCGRSPGRRTTASGPS